MTEYYILKGKNPVPANLMTWATWFTNNDRVVAKTRIGTAEVSTVFLGLNHNLGEGDPLLFETMVFGGEHDQECERYSTYEQAEKGHKEMCGKIAP